MWCCGRSRSYFVLAVACESCMLFACLGVATYILEVIMIPIRCGSESLSRLRTALSPFVGQTLFNCYPNLEHEPWATGVATGRGGKDEADRYGEINRFTYNRMTRQARQDLPRRRNEPPTPHQNDENWPLPFDTGHEPAILERHTAQSTSRSIVFRSLSFTQGPAVDALFGPTRVGSRSERRTRG